MRWRTKGVGQAFQSGFRGRVRLESPTYFIAGAVSEAIGRSSARK